MVLVVNGTRGGNASMPRMRADLLLQKGVALVRRFKTHFRIAFLFQRYGLHCEFGCCMKVFVFFRYGVFVHQMYACSCTSLHV